MFYNRKGCSKTGNLVILFDFFFVPGHLFLPLSRDKGTPDKDFFCPVTKVQQVVPSWFVLGRPSGKIDGKIQKLGANTLKQCQRGP